MKIDYIPYLRKMIGHKKCISIGLSAMVFNKEKKVLLEKRKDNGKYCFPGGSIDLNETVIEGLEREIKEETGIEIQDIKLFAIRSGEKCDFYYPNGDVTQYLDLIFLAKEKEDSIIIPQESETDGVFYISIEDLKKIKKEDMLNSTYFTIQKYLNNNFEITID